MYMLFIDLRYSNEAAIKLFLEQSRNTTSQLKGDGNPDDYYVLFERS